MLLALHTRAGEQAGLSLGDVQGFLQTIQSLVKLPVPMTYGQLYLVQTAQAALFIQCVVSEISAFYPDKLRSGMIIQL